jgi:hypothetical protein
MLARLVPVIYTRWCICPVSVVLNIRDPGHELVEKTVFSDRYYVETSLAEGVQSGTAVSQQVDGF